MRSIRAFVVLLGAVAAALLAVPAPAGAAESDYTVVAGAAACNAQARWVVPFTVTATDPVPEGATWVSFAASAGDVQGAPAPGTAVTTVPLAVTVTAPTGGSGAVSLTVAATYPGGDPEDKVTIGSASLAAVCPGVPTNVNSANTTEKQTTLTWAGAAHATSYEIQRCQGSGCTPSGAAVGTVTGTSFTNTGLTANTWYRYRLRALSGTVPSAWSGVISVRTKLSASETPSATPTGVGPSAAPTTDPAVVAAATSVAASSGRTTEIGGFTPIAPDHGPSVIMIGITAAIFVGLVVALIFLFRERSRLRRDAAGPASAEVPDDDDDVGYWSSFHRS